MQNDTSQDMIFLPIRLGKIKSLHHKQLVGKAGARFSLFLVEVSICETSRKSNLPMTTKILLHMTFNPVILLLEIDHMDRLVHV